MDDDKVTQLYKDVGNSLGGLLRDFAQGASNSVASNVGVPVDLMAWMLRKGGVNVPPNPVGGTDWMAEKGLTREPQNKLAGFLGDMAGMVTPFSVANNSGKVASNLLRMSENATKPKTARQLQTGAITWHGSPHTFDAEKLVKLISGEEAFVGGRFNKLKEAPAGSTLIEDFPFGRIRMEGIGTGEGAQAYGHGGYLAGAQDVGKSYANVGSDLANRYKLSYGNAENALPAITRKRDDYEWLSSSPYDGNKAKLENIIRSYDDAIHELKNGAPKNTGNLYKVALPDEHIAKMLDWDKPLSEQNPNVLKAMGYHNQPRNFEVEAKAIPGTAEYANLEKMMDSRVGSPSVPNVTGGEWYRSKDDLLRGSNIDEIGRSKYLSELGIPGIRYLDGGSRGAGAGTSNYVVFPGNERLLKILERNGQQLP